jgi:hypothetical protein
MSLSGHCVNGFIALTQMALLLYVTHQGPVNRQNSRANKSKSSKNVFVRESPPKTILAASTAKIYNEY